MNIYGIFCINEVLISLIWSVVSDVTFCTKRLYNNPEAGIHVTCWNYLHECSGVTGGGIVPPPPHFSLGNFMIYWEKRVQGRKGNGEEKKENLKGKRWKIEMEGERYENEQRTSFLLVTFLWTILPGKIIFHVGKKQETWFCTLWKIFVLKTEINGGYWCFIKYISFTWWFPKVSNY